MAAFVTVARAEFLALHLALERFQPIVVVEVRLVIAVQLSVSGYLELKRSEVLAYLLAGCDVARLSATDARRLLESRTV